MTDQDSDPDDSTAETDEGRMRSLATPHTSSDWKVLGQHASSSGAGVLGHNTATSGPAPGVKGVTDSTDDVASGVKGEASGDYVAPLGVHGETSALGYATGQVALIPVYSAGVLGRATATSGVAYNAGVRGVNSATSGAGYGVMGQTSTSDPAGAGVYASGGANGAAAVIAKGHVDVTQVGVSAYLSGNQTIESGNTEVVDFDTASNDDFQALSSGTYTVATAGDYHVDFTIQWFAKDGDFDGSALTYELQTSGTVTAGISAQISQDDADPRSFSKTLFGLDVGDTIEVVIDNSQSGDLTVLGGSGTDSFLTINKVG